MLEFFFKPKSVAVIGASREEGKVGHSILKNIIQHKFKGNIYPVNPKADEILQHKCYSNISAIPQEIDMAVVVVPAKFVPPVMEECGIKGVKGVVVISAGFKEVGGEGLKLEKQLIESAKKYNMRLWGPNCLGLIDTYSSLNASFAKGMPTKGNIGFMSQSGALGTAILDWAQAKEIGFSKFVSMGNKADVDENDFLRDWDADENTKVITGYLENIKDGPGFMEISRIVTKRTPVVIVKSGSTSAGARAASSHTGSLCGLEASYDAAFKQTGVIRANSMEDLFDLARGFAFQPLPQGRRTAIVTNAGGPGIITVDACEKSGLKIASFEPATIEYLRTNLPPAANIYNPVDVLGDASASLYRLALEAVLKDANVDSVIVLLTPQAPTEVEKTAHVIIELGKIFKKPILSCFMGEATVSSGMKILNENKFPVYSFPERAASVLVTMAKHREWVDEPEHPVRHFEVKKEDVNEVIQKVREKGRVNLVDVEAMKVIQAYGIDIVKSKLATTPDEAVEAAQALGYPVVMKIASPEILHKSDIGGVRVGINNEQEVRDIFEIMLIRAKRFFPDVPIWGVSIQEIIREGKEVILGMSRDPQFGPLVMFGLGGIYVEVLKDVAFRVAPFSEKEALEMVQEIKTYPLLSGVRGEKPVDIHSIVDCLLRSSQLVTDFPEILEMDINPLKVSNKGALAIDARITIK